MASKDNRVTLKIEKKLWKEIEILIESHPEWGVISVPEFVRRAIDSEIRDRKESETKRVITLCLSSENEDKSRKDP
ncbi:MAG: hypothetical protein JSV94_02580 [Methanobacteriota archaeon]|nr:MAG: hypothetical protein JSV94_02580 [Euryarchaeota archaeon]